MNRFELRGKQNFLGIDIPIIYAGINGDEKVILTKTIADIHDMGLGHINELINNNLDEFEVGIDILDIKGSIDKSTKIKLRAYGLTQNSLNASKNIYLLSEKGYRIFSSLTKSKKDLSKQLLNEYFNSRYILEPKNTKEYNFYTTLKEALIPFGITDGEEQYSILNNKGTNFRIDYYIPSLNVAIEYDEKIHTSYTYDRQEGRQKEIEDKLGCKFIRVTDENTIGYNVGLIIKDIINI